MSIIQTFPLSPSVDTSDCMKKGVDYVTAGAATGSTIGSNATAEGNDVVASGKYSHAEGCETTADGSYAHAEGFQTSASDYGHAEGYLTTAEGYIAHAEGYSTYSYGTGSHSEGESTFAEGQRSHAEGYGTIASGEAAHTEGGYTTAAGDYSHAEGYYTYAEGNYSHAEGYCTTAYGDNQTVVGKYNIVDTNGDYAFIVGNGTSTTASNALGVKWDGTVEAGGHALGTAAFKNIPSSGNAGNSEVVLGNDSRLSDSRTPTSHTHTKSEITDFPTLGTAAAKDYTSSVTQSSSDLVTSGAVWTAIDNLPEPMVFKGTLGTGGTITSLPTAAAANHGDTYKVITAGTYASIVAKVGDVFTSDGSSWVLIPAGDTDTDTWRAIKINGTEKLGSAISTDAVDFVNGTNTTVSFDATGSKISVSVPAVSSTSAGVAPKGASVSSQSQSTKFLREDGSWSAPSYSTVNNATLTIQKNGTTVNTFTANASSNVTANITVPTKTSDLTNDSGFITTDEKVTAEAVDPSTETIYRGLFVPDTGATNNQKPKAAAGVYLYLKNGSSSNLGYAALRLGNSTASGTAGNKYGELWMYSEKSGYVKLRATANSTSNRTIYLPDKNGTIALTADLTTYAFAEGTNNGEIKITPSVGGTAQTAVTVKPKGISDLAYIAKGSGSSKFLREDGQWTTVTASWSGGDITQDILPASGYTLHLGSGTRPFENVVSTYLTAKSSVSIGKTNATTGKIYLYQSNSSYSSIIQPSDIALSAAQTFKLPSASGTLATQEWADGKYALKTNFTLNALSSVNFYKWNTNEYGFILIGTDGKGVQLVINRSTRAINAWSVG